MGGFVPKIEIIAIIVCGPIIQQERHKRWQRDYKKGELGQFGRATEVVEERD
jgi:hypothetical protein